MRALLTALAFLVERGLQAHAGSRHTQAPAAVARGLSSHGRQALERRLNGRGAGSLVAPRQVGSSQTRDRTNPRLLSWQADS